MTAPSPTQFPAPPKTDDIIDSLRRIEGKLTKATERHSSVDGLSFYTERRSSVDGLSFYGVLALLFVWSAATAIIVTALVVGQYQSAAIVLALGAAVVATLAVTRYNIEIN